MPDDCTPDMFETDAGLREYVTRTGDTIYHPVGTCRMGPAGEATSVVDPTSFNVSAHEVVRRWA